MTEEPQDDTSTGYETNYVADPVQVAVDLHVGYVVYGTEGRKDEGVDLINDDGEVLAELDESDCRKLVQELASLIGA